MAQLDPVANLDSCGRLVGLRTLAVPMAFGDGHLESRQVLIESAGGDETDEQLDLLRIHPRRTWGVGASIRAGIGVGVPVSAVTGPEDLG